MVLPSLRVSTEMIQGAITQNVLNTYSQSIFSQGYLEFDLEVDTVSTKLHYFNINTKPCLR